MPTQDAIVPVCRCPVCQQPQDHADKVLHHRMNLFFSRLDEQQRRWYAALESLKVGPGGDVLLSQVTGLNVATIRRGREELQGDLEGRPANQVRLPGGGRWPVEKKTPLC